MLRDIKDTFTYVSHGTTCVLLNMSCQSKCSALNLGIQHTHLQQCRPYADWTALTQSGPALVGDSRGTAQGEAK